MFDKDRAERERKLALMRSFLESKEWELLKEDWSKQVQNLKDRTTTMLLDSADDKSRAILVNDGFRIGVEWCLNRPKQIKDDNEKYLDQLIKRVFGEAKKDEEKNR